MTNDEEMFKLIEEVRCSTDKKITLIATPEDFILMGMSEDIARKEEKITWMGIECLILPPSGNQALNKIFIVPKGDTEVRLIWD